MRPIYSAAAEAYRLQVRAFLTAQLPAGWMGEAALPDSERSAWRERWRSILASAGMLAVAWPREFGGAGLSPLEQVVLAEEFAAANASLLTGNDPFGIGMVGPTIMVCGTDAQRRHFLPRIISGEDRWCQGYSEPDAGSDLAGVATRAVLDGDRWVINGQKIWTSEGHTANWIFLLARTDPEAPKHAGISFMLVPMDQPGIEVRPIKEMTGESLFNEVFFTDAVTARDNVVGPVNEGWSVANTLLGFERGGGATVISIGYRRELDRIVELARGRGRHDDPVIRDRLARAHTDVEILRYLGMRSLTRALAGDGLGPETSIVKLYWSEYHQRVTELALDILGTEATAPGGDPTGASYLPFAGPRLDPAAAVRTFLYARPGTIYAGTSEIQRNILGERVLGLPRR